MRTIIVHNIEFIGTMKTVYQSSLHGLFFYLHILEQKLDALSFVFKLWRIIQFIFINFLILRRTLVRHNPYFSQVISPALKYIDRYTLMQRPQQIFIVVISGFSLIFTLLLIFTKNWKQSIKNTGIKCYLFVFVALRLIIFPIISQFYFLVTSQKNQYPLLGQLRFIVYFPITILLLHIIVQSNKRSVYGIFHPFIPVLYHIDMNDVPLFIGLIIPTLYYFIKKPQHSLKIFADTAGISVVFGVLCNIGKNIDYTDLLIYGIVNVIYVFNYFQGKSMLIHQDKQIQIQNYCRYVFDKKEIRADSHDQILVQMILLQQFMYSNFQNKFLKTLNLSSVITWKADDHLKLLQSQTSINLCIQNSKNAKLLKYKSELENKSHHYLSLVDLNNQFRQSSLNISYKYRIYIMLKQLQIYYDKFKTQQQFIKSSKDLDNKVCQFYQKVLNCFDSLSKVWKYLSLETINFENVQLEYQKVMINKNEAATIFNCMAEKCKLGVQFSHMLKMTTILDINPTEQKKMQITNKLKLEDHFPFVIINDGKIKYSSFKFNKLFKYNPAEIVGFPFDAILPQSFRNNFFKQNYNSTLLISEQKILILDGSDHLILVDINVYINPNFIESLDYVVCFLQTNLDGKMLFLYLPESDQIECGSSSFRDFSNIQRGSIVLGKQLFNQIDLTNQITIKALNDGITCTMNCSQYEAYSTNIKKIKLVAVQQFIVKNKKRLLVQIIRQQYIQSPTKIRSNSSQFIYSLSSRIVAFDEFKEDYIDQSDSTVDNYLSQLLQKKQALNEHNVSKTKTPIIILAITQFFNIVITGLSVMFCFYKAAEKLKDILTKLHRIAQMNFSIANLFFKSFTLFHYKFFPPLTTTVYLQQLIESAVSNLNASIYDFQQRFFKTFDTITQSTQNITLVFSNYSSVYSISQTYLINIVYQAATSTSQSIQFLVNNFGIIEGIKNKLSVSQQEYQQIQFYINMIIIIIFISCLISAILIGSKFLYVVKLQNMLKDIGRLFTFMISSEIDKQIATLGLHVENCEKIYKKQIQQSPQRQSFGSLRKLMKRNTQKKITLHRNSIIFTADMAPKARKIKYSNKYYYFKIFKLAAVLMIGVVIIVSWVPRSIELKNTIKRILDFQKQYYESVIQTKNHLVKVYHHIMSNQTNSMVLNDTYINTLLLGEQLLPPDYFIKGHVWKLLNQNLCELSFVTSNVNYSTICKNIFLGTLTGGLSKSIDRYMIYLNRLSHFSLRSQQQQQNITIIFQQLKMAQLFIMNGISHVSHTLMNSFYKYISSVFVDSYLFIGICVIIIVIYGIYAYNMYSQIQKRRELCKSLFNLIPNQNFLLYHLKRFMQDKRIVSRLLKL